MRIVSLIASSTEIVSALGFQDQLVGRSHECDYPESVLKLPVCSEPKFKTEGTSREIDERVKRIVQESLSVYRIDTEQLKQLRPDVIVTQDHCEVCAVSLKDVEAAVCEWLDSKPKIVTLHPDALADIWSGILKVAEALGNAKAGTDLVAQLQDRMRKISEQAKKLSLRTTVASIEWIDPLMAGGNWVPEMIQMLGGVSAFGEAGKHSPWMTFEELAAKDPEVIAVMPCGWDIERSLQEMSVLTDRPEWQKLQAVKKNQVYMTDGNQYFNRPGPRVVESLEILAEILYPDAFHFGHEGTGWKRLDQCLVR